MTSFNEQILKANWNSDELFQKFMRTSPQDARALWLCSADEGKQYVQTIRSYAPDAFDADAELGQTLAKVATVMGATFGAAIVIVPASLFLAYTITPIALTGLGLIPLVSLVSYLAIPLIFPNDVLKENVELAVAIEGYQHAYKQTILTVLDLLANAATSRIAASKKENMPVEKEEQELATLKKRIEDFKQTLEKKSPNEKEVFQEGFALSETLKRLASIHLKKIWAQYEKSIQVFNNQLNSSIKKECAQARQAVEALATYLNTLKQKGSPEDSELLRLNQLCNNAECAVELTLNYPHATADEINGSLDIAEKMADELQSLVRSSLSREQSSLLRKTYLVIDALKKLLTNTSGSADV
jgi:hypothetical protein